MIYPVYCFSAPLVKETNIYLKHKVILITSLLFHQLLRVSSADILQFHQVSDAKGGGTEMNMLHSTHLLLLKSHNFQIILTDFFLSLRIRELSSVQPLPSRRFHRRLEAYRIDCRSAKREVDLWSLFSSHLSIRFVQCHQMRVVLVIRHLILYIKYFVIIFWIIQNKFKLLTFSLNWLLAWLLFSQKQVLSNVLLLSSNSGPSYNSIVAAMFNLECSICFVSTFMLSLHSDNYFVCKTQIITHRHKTCAFVDTLSLPMNTNSVSFQTSEWTKWGSSVDWKYLHFKFFKFFYRNIKLTSSGLAILNSLSGRLTAGREDTERRSAPIFNFYYDFHWFEALKYRWNTGLRFNRDDSRLSWDDGFRTNAHRWGWWGFRGLRGCKIDNML